eukprot:COSAG02_NODE_352_length_24036_cov_20.479258_10_plen_178_part_00
MGYRMKLDNKIGNRKVMLPGVAAGSGVPGALMVETGSADNNLISRNRTVRRRVLAKPKTTASSAGLTTPARCRNCPPTSSPPQHTYQLQECGARRAISPAFISSPALLHQHRAQPRAAARFLQNAESVICMGGTRCIGRLIKVCGRARARVPHVQVAELRDDQGAAAHPRPICCCCL